MLKRYTVQLPTPHGTTIGVVAHLTTEQVDNLRRNGYEVDRCLNLVPDWAVRAGLTRAYCFLEDLLTFQWGNLFKPR